MIELHVAFVIGTLIVVVISDGQGVLWLFGIKKILSAKFVDILHKVVSVGIGGLLLTGGLMFLEQYDYLLQNIAFLSKMALVFALIVNAFCIGSIAKLATSKPFAALTLSERVSVLSSGALSMMGWVGAVILGLLL